VDRATRRAEFARPRAEQAGLREDLVLLREVPPDYQAYTAYRGRSRRHAEDSRQLLDAPREERKVGTADAAESRPLAAMVGLRHHAVARRKRSGTPGEGEAQPGRPAAGPRARGGIRR